MSKELRILQSGFITVMNSTMVQDTRKELTLQNAVRSESIFKADTVNFYDETIEGFCRQMNAGNNVIGDFAFREAVIKKAMSLFGFKTNFTEWFHLQHQSPVFGFLHERYLMETLDFVYNAKPRKMSHSNYRRMLYVNMNDIQHVVGDKENTYVSLHEAIASLGDMQNISFYEQWTNSAERLQDMLLTMDVIFGRRSSPGM